MNSKFLLVYGNGGGFERNALRWDDNIKIEIN
jgi:hypothetical protein